MSTEHFVSTLHVLSDPDEMKFHPKPGFWNDVLCVDLSHITGIMDAVALGQ